MARIPVIVGMNNPLSDDPRYALYPYPDGSAGHRLYEMLSETTGALRVNYLRAFERVNLVESRTWSAAAARAAAGPLLEKFVGRTLVLLGQDVAQALNIPAATPWLAPRRVQVSLVPRVVTTLYKMPHPSGRNRWYNVEDNRRAAAEFLARLYRESVVGGGEGGA